MKASLFRSHLQALLLLVPWIPCSLHADLPNLHVGPDHKHLVTEEGKPFFLLGDTAWELVHRLTREETEAYLQNRAEKGFNTILTVALAEFDFDQPNAYGELPLENNDPSKPRDAYFTHLDWVIDQAASRGLYTALLPTWGDKWNKKWGRGPEIFTPENATIFCEWLATRYKDKPIIWILGGDRSVDTDPQRAIIRAMAAGLKKGDGGKHLISFHPQGGKNSSDFWPDEPWLDFHMFQSGHGKQATPNFNFNAKNLALPALKPTLDGEPNYEDHPVRGLMEGKTPTVWFDDYDARRAAWWSILSGACGHVYGTHSIWQFHDPKKRPAITDARTPWQQAMDLPGAAQMGILKKFFEGLEWAKLERNDAIMTQHLPPLPEERVMAAKASDGSFAVVYSPGSKKSPLSLNWKALDLEPAQYDVQTFDPKTGLQIQEVRNGASVSTFSFGPEVRDWVLLIRRK